MQYMQTTGQLSLIRVWMYGYIPIDKNLDNTALTQPIHIVITYKFLHKTNLHHITQTFIGTSEICGNFALIVDKSLNI